MSASSSRAFTCLSLALLAAAALSPAHAQNKEGTGTAELPRPPLVNLSDDVTFEVAPHTGLMGSSGTFGLNLMMTYSAFSIELAGEQVIGKTANLYPLSVNVILNLSTRGRLIPYGAVGAGLWLTVPTSAIGASTVSTFGVNFGGGARYFLTRSFGVRLEAKQYFTSVSDPRGLKSELLFFQEASLGVTFLFH